MPQPLRVLHISLSSAIGGGPEHVWQQVRHLPDHVTSLIAAPVGEPYGPRFAAAVGAEHCCPLPERRFSLWAFGRLLRFIKEQHVTLIHSHGKGAGLYGRPAALLCGLPCVHTFHGIHLPGRPLPRILYLNLERTLCAMSRACIAVSASEAAQARELGLGGQRLHTIPNGVEIPATLPRRERPRPFTLVHVSRFDRRAKNSLWLAELAAGLRQAGLLELCRFVLIGEGEELPALQEKLQARQLLPFFQFLGRQASSRPSLREAGCYISTSRWEGLPLAVLEAQAEGLPAVLSRVVGNTDAAEDGRTALFYELDDVAGAVACIRTLLEDATLWQSMRQAAHARAQKLFSVQTMANRTAELYAACLADRSAHRP